MHRRPRPTCMHRERYAAVKHSLEDFSCGGGDAMMPFGWFTVTLRRICAASSPVKRLPLAMARKGIPKMIGTSSSSSISRTTKSTGKMNLLIFTNRFSQTSMRAGKGRSCMLIPDLVVMEKVGASGKDHCKCLLRTSIPARMGCPAHIHQPHRILRRKDHYKCLLRTSIPARMGCPAHIHQPHRILRSNRKSGRGFKPNLSSRCFEIVLILDVFIYSIASFFVSERAEVELGPRYVLSKKLVKELGHELIPCRDLSRGILSRHSAAFPLMEKWKNLNLDVSLVAPSSCMLSTMLKYCLI
nr:hypothetical protein [Tanacetum cinerariifolium]